jgi:enoyl-CoA hydratase/carnithine racemase
MRPSRAPAERRLPVVSCDRERPRGPEAGLRAQRREERKMAYECILMDVEDRVATITLNRPDRMNAWNPQLAADLCDALDVCDRDDGVRAVVLTGAGRAFCAGADLGGRGDTFRGRGERPRPRREIYPWQLDKPVIAALNGHAIGVGITYPLMCDIRFVAEDAKIAFAFVRRGVIPELASHAILPRVVGFSNAADLLMSGRTIRGREAAEMGLASRALPADQVLPAALEHAREIATNAAPVSREPALRVDRTAAGCARGGGLFPGAAQAGLVPLPVPRPPRSVEAVLNGERRTPPSPCSAPQPSARSIRRNE